MKSTELYLKLIEKLDSYETRLLAEYGNSVACRRGCAECCILESVFPVEAFYIYSSISDKQNRFSIPAGAGSKCVFLENDSCSIYPCRPVICRTHGYPLMESGRIDFCPKNFTGISSIDSGFILDLDALNRALASINIIFIKENNDSFFKPERILMSDILKHYTESCDY